MKAFRAVMLLLFLAVTSATAQPSASGSVTGVVVCDDTHGPARRAYVYLQAPISREARFVAPQETFGGTTDADGAFAISDVTPGEYYVVVFSPGYISARDYLFPGAMSAKLSGAQEALPSFVKRVSVVAGGTEHAAIELKRGGSISGTVSYSDGTPVPYVGLTPKLKSKQGDFADLIGNGASHTDSLGRYRIEGLPDGSYVVLGGMEGAMVPVFGGDQMGGSGLTIFAGGGMRPSQARVIVVTGPNEYPGVNITIPLSGVYEVGGALAAADGHRLNQGLVRLFPAGEPRFSSAAPVEADGSFHFHRIPGDRYTIRVEDASDWKDNGGVRTLVQKYRSSSVDVDVAEGNVSGVLLTADPIP